MNRPGEDLAEVFVGVVDALADEHDLNEVLRMVATQATVISPTRDAGLLLADERGHLQVMATSDDGAKVSELCQLQTPTGPSQECFRSGSPVVHPDLSQAVDRWPIFAARAVAAGYRSVHAFPLRLRQRIIGTLNLFGANGHDMPESEARTVQALADVTTIGLLQERSRRLAETVNQQLQDALGGRIITEQAKGALAQIHGVSPDQAFDKMQTYSDVHHLQLGVVASIVVNDPRSLPALTRPSW